MDMKKYAALYNEANKNIVQAIKKRDIARFNKFAESTDLLFKTYTYTAGQQRQIYTELSGKDQVEVVSADDPRRMYDHDNERVFMRIYLQPDFLRNAHPADIMQTWGSPYMRRVSGGVVEGTFSHVESPEVIKKVKEVSTYGYDFIGMVQKDTVKYVLDREDRAGYMKDYFLIGAQEALLPGTGILTVTQDQYEERPNIYVKNLYKLHAMARRNNQKRALTVFPDYLWMDLYTIEDNKVRGISREGLDAGFGDKASSDVFDNRVLRFDDDRYLTYDGSATGNSHFAGGTAGLELFGYNTSKTPADYGFDGSIYTSWTATAGSQKPLAECSFKRIMVYAPEAYYGKMFIDDPDLRTSIRYENDFVMIKSYEDLAFLAHNIYAVTALDVWNLD